MTTRLAHPLTRRETEVLALIAEGWGNRAIAERLCIAESTAQVHVAHVFYKLGVSNRPHAVMVAMAQGLIPGPTADELAARYLDADDWDVVGPPGAIVDEPYPHVFRGGVFLPGSCMGCGEPQSASWHINGAAS